MLSPPSADEFHGEYLLERSSSPEQREAVAPPSRPIARRAASTRPGRWRPLYRGLGGYAPEGAAPTEAELSRLEDRLESGAPLPQDELTKALDDSASVLAKRLVARGAAQAGYLVLNPCSFQAARRASNCRD